MAKTAAGAGLHCLQLGLLLVASLRSVELAVHPINLLFVNDADNAVAAQALDALLSFLRAANNESARLRIADVRRVAVAGENAQAQLEDICRVYDAAVEGGHPPHLLLDATMTGVTSETVKSFAAALSLPTISASYGQEKDIRQWRTLDEEKEKYMVQVMPPADMAPEAIRSVVTAQNITNAGILFDDSFVMEHKYKSLLQNIPTRHVIAEVSATNVRRQLARLRDLDLFNFFVLGRMSTVNAVLEAAAATQLFGRKYAWHAIALESSGQVKCSCANASVLLLRPEADVGSRQRLATLRSAHGLTAQPEVTAAFYFDLYLRALLAIATMMDSGAWPKEMQFATCSKYTEGSELIRVDLNLRKALKEVTVAPSYAPLVISTNGHSFPEFAVRVERVEMSDGRAARVEDVGSWRAGLDSPIRVKKHDSMANFSVTIVYRVVTVIQRPFVFVDGVDESGGPRYRGYCVDLLEEIRNLTGFEYEVYEAPDKQYGNMDDNGQWNGAVKELIEKRADIALGAMSVMAERENVVDFTVPYYDLVGITILMKKPKTPTSLFKFLTVLENDVWVCILVAYFFTSFLMWVFDRWSPYSYQNNRDKYKHDEEKREFNLKECLWFCMTSLTPQGGGEAPKNLSGRLVAATWWLFGFIIIASYTANLAAFLTVSRLESPVESLDDLSKQYKILYAPLNGSAAMTYFQRMADIETRFYEIWKEMSLNDSLSQVERAKLAVWDYPVSDKYTKIWQAMKEAGFPATMDEALERVRKSATSSEGFAYIGDATDVRYQVMTSCDLQMVGEEFSRKPYAVATQQGSPLKDQFNNAILQLLNKRKLEKLKERWWNANPERKSDCEKEDDQSDGISIQNIGGVFIVIFVGIGLACVTLVFEYWWYKYKRAPLPAAPLAAAPSTDAGVTTVGKMVAEAKRFGTFRRHGASSLTSVANPW